MYPVVRRHSKFEVFVCMEAHEIDFVQVYIWLSRVASSVGQVKSNTSTMRPMGGTLCYWKGACLTKYRTSQTEVNHTWTGWLVVFAAFLIWPCTNGLGWKCLFLWVWAIIALLRNFCNLVLFSFGWVRLGVGACSLDGFKLFTPNSISTRRGDVDLIKESPSTDSGGWKVKKQPPQWEWWYFTRLRTVIGGGMVGCLVVWR